MRGPIPTHSAPAVGRVYTKQQFCSSSQLFKVVFYVRGGGLACRSKPALDVRASERVDGDADYANVHDQNHDWIECDVYYHAEYHPRRHFRRFASDPDDITGAGREDDERGAGSELPQIITGESDSRPAQSTPPFIEKSLMPSSGNFLFTARTVFSTRSAFRSSQ